VANILSKFAKYASNVPSFTFILHVHRQANCCSKTFFWNSLSEPHLRHLQSSVAVFNEQFQNIEKTKAQIVEVVSCRATAKTTIQERESDVRMKLSDSTLQKFREESKDRDCDLLMSDVSVLYKSCVAYLENWFTLFAEFQCFA